VQDPCYGWRKVRVRVLGVALAAALLTGALCSQAQAVSVAITGPEEIIYDYSTQACDVVDMGDGRATAFRDGLGRLQILMAQPNNRRLIGTNFNDLTHDCSITMGSDLSPYPWEFNDQEWIAAPWAKADGTVDTLVHSEYHGQRHPGWCPGNVFIRCRYNTVTLAQSINNGDTFTQAPPPNHLVAALPYPYWPDAGRYGVFGPSNLFEHDGFIYNFLLISEGVKEQAPGACLMRTREQDLDDRRSWRVWDGTGFNSRFINPYLESGEPIRRHTCQPVDPDHIGTMQRSIVFNTQLNKFILSGNSAKFDPVRGEDVTGFYYSTSDDLIHWTERQLIMEVESQQSHMCGDDDVRLYPSFIDHDSPRRNFDTMDNTAYVYYTIGHYTPDCQFGNDRDMARIPIQWSP
jgi:hypothetical protein